MNIAYIYEDGFSRNNGSNALHKSIIQELINEGHRVFLFQTSFEPYDGNQLFSNHEFFKCFSFVVKKIKKTDFVRRYLNGLEFCRKCKKEFKTLNIDLFFMQSSPTISYNISNAKRYKKPIIYNIYDVFPGSAYKLGIIKFKFLDFVLKKVQRIGYKKSNKIIVMAEDMKEVLIKEKANPSKIEIVQNWYDFKFTKEKNNEFVQENNIDLSKFIVQYAGNIGQVFAEKEMAFIINATKDNNLLEFHIIGDGARLDQLKKDTLLCKNVRFFEWQPFEIMHDIYSYCDIEIIPLHNGVIGNNIPSKTALVLASGKPILCIIEKSHFTKSVSEEGVGFCFEQNDLQTASNFLNTLSLNKQTTRAMADKCIMYAKEHYSKNNLRKIIEIINEYENFDNRIH